MKTQNPWMGRARGSAGNMTSSKVYDKNVMRAKAFEVNNPKTAAQTTERNFFAECQQLSQALSEEQLRSLFPNKPKSKSRRNSLLSQLLGNYAKSGSKKYFAFDDTISLGNGKRMNCRYFFAVDSSDPITDYIPDLVDDTNYPSNATLILVGYNDDNKQLVLSKGTVDKEHLGEKTFEEVFNVESTSLNGYITIAEKENDVTSKNWGTFGICSSAV